MINKKNLFMIGVLFLFLIMFLSFINAGTSYCCEKTTYGAYCQLESDVDKCSTAVKDPNTGENYQKAPTFCESTPYCKLGTCVDVQEGLCHEKTPKITCERDGGNWYDKDADELPQCQEGCCLLGDQAAFVPQNRCKALSSLYGLETIFRNDILNEFVCIASASSDEKGACVIEKEYEKTCKFITKRECQAMEASSGEETIEFHEGYLCSADELATNCGPKGGTTCVEDEDEVYFLDTCGNLANIYDYSKINEPDYWTYIEEPTCGGSESKNSRECGNCEYYFGSTCKSYRQTNAPAPRYGDYICADLDCKDSDFRSEYRRDPKHGEIWCVMTDKDVESNQKGYLPGTEHYRFKCWEGEIIPEPCDPGRATICNQTDVGGDFKYAFCQPNKWQDCNQQETEENCEDEENRDCQWIVGLSILKDEEGKERRLENENEEELKSSCVPKYPPSGQANSQCQAASIRWLLTYEYNLAQDKDKLTEWPDWAANSACEGGSENYKTSQSGCFTLPGHDYYRQWETAAKNICSFLGDCGADINYVGAEGDNEEYIEYGEIGG